MSKGGKLKEMGLPQKQQGELKNMEQSRKEKSKANLLKDQPIVVPADNSEAVDQSKPKSDESNAKESEDYHSQTLSKKDKRKLKKKMRKEQRNETVEDAEDAEDAESSKEAKDEDEDEDEDEKHLDLERLAQSESEDEDDDEDDDNEAETKDQGEVEEQTQKEEDDEEKDVPLSDVEFDSDADVVPHQKLTMNNTNALRQSLQRIQLPWSKNSFEEHVSVTSKTNTDEGIKDIYDDTERELAFYKQSLDSVNYAREQLKKLKVPFKRPLDYFAEMVKSDEHMDKIKGKLVTEASEKKARQDAKRQRDLKKFGKQVQVATLQKRQLEKRDTLEKIKALKNKRKHSEIGEDEFNVGVEEATKEAADSGPKRQKVNHKRESKDKKYGQGGMKRFKRKNDASSSAEMSGFSHRKMKGRPGRSRRQKKF